jgi:hypothetical protein
MTTLKVNSISDAAGTGKPDFSQGLTVAGSATIETTEYYSSSSEPSNPGNGAIWYDTTNSEAKVYTNGAWYTLTRQPTINIVWYGNRGLTAGFSTSDDRIDYYDITTAGNATDFGNMSSGGYGNSGMTSNGTRAVFGGVGWVGGLGNPTTIDYYTTATPSNSTDFGDLTVGRNPAALSNGTYGVFAGGGGTVNVIDYITIENTGNATDFGDTLANLHSASALSDATRGVIGGGFSGGSNSNVMQYVTVDTPSNSIDFGDLLATNKELGACSDTTRGLFCGGNNTNVLQYITIANTGNATDFGDLTIVSKGTAACSNGTRAVISLSRVDHDTASNRMDFVTIQTTGNASDFGDLTTTTQVKLASTSGAAS